MSILFRKNFKLGKYIHLNLSKYDSKKVKVGLNIGTSTLSVDHIFGKCNYISSNLLPKLGIRVTKFW